MGMGMFGFAPDRPVVYAEKGQMKIVCPYSPFDWPIVMSRPIRAEYYSTKKIMDVWYDHGEHQQYSADDYCEATFKLSCIWQSQNIICHFIND